MFTETILGFISSAFFSFFPPPQKPAQTEFYPTGIEIVILNNSLPSSVSIDLTERFSKRFDISLSVLRADLDITSTFNRRRGQIDGQEMLDLADFRNKESGTYVIYVITEDLYAKDYNFLFAFTDFAQHETVISTHRFFDEKTAPKTVTDRMEKVLLRRIGFAYGLASNECVMYFSNSLKEFDTVAPRYCPEDERILISQGVLKPQSPPQLPQDNR